MRRPQELKLPGQVSRKLEAVLKVYGVEDAEGEKTEKKHSVVPVAPSEGRCLLPLSSWWRARHPTRKTVTTTSPRKQCFDAPPKWTRTRRPRVNLKTSSSVHSGTGSERNGVFDITVRRRRLKAVGKELKEAKRLSLPGLQQVFHESITNKTQEQRMEMWELHRLARESNLAVDEVVSIKAIFDSFDADETGTLELEEFQNVAMEVLSAQLEETTQARDRVLELCQRTFAMMDVDHSGSLDFEEFLRWYASRSFSESLLLTDSERELRSLSRHCGVDMCTVDKVKEYFNAADTDKSGRIEYDEFAAVLPRMMKVPPGVTLPESRIRHFWKEVDTDRDETIVFSEFLVWWCQYLNTDTNVEDFLNMQNDGIIHNFYKSMRNIGHLKFDPRPKQPERQEDEPEDNRGVPASSPSFFSLGHPI